MKAIILAAGFGTRLYPLTENTPKALLKVGNKSILDYLIEKLDAISIIDEIIIVSNSRFYIDFSVWLNEAKYKKQIHLIENGVFEPRKSLGAIGDLNFALRSGFCGSDDFMVFCGDNLFDFPLSHFLLPCLGHRDDVFVGIYDVKDPDLASECGVVTTDSHNVITSFIEKPRRPKSTKVAIGVYYFPGPYRLRVYEYLFIDELNPDRIGDFIAWLTKKQPLNAVDFDGVWFDIGTIQSYELAQKIFNDRMAA
ncbi:MAG TPA: nucleotidyltransferase family protein [Candidatus Omnitrophota bacterium]|nr:nucleotidyltransferase family protein [Candidatus Omnitrophota bacterium]